MTWEFRLKEASIITPDFEVYFFQYDDVEKEITKKTSQYQFGDIDKALVQDFGLGVINFPMTIFFSGPTYDFTAEAFEESASLRGVSILDHPIYGTKDVVITRLVRRDNLRSGGGQAVFSLTMTETLVDPIPESLLDTKLSIEALQEGFIDINSASFAAGFNVSAINDLLAAKNRILSAVNSVKDTFNDVIKTVDSINQAFNEISNFINGNIDFLLGAPLLLADSIQRLIKAPARVIASAKARASAYLKEYEKFSKPAAGKNKADTKNQRQEKQLFMTAIVSAITEVNLYPDTDEIGFLTKVDAITATIELITLYNETQEFLDNEEKTSVTDNLENRFIVSDSVTQSIKEITAKTAQDLVRLSFSLQQERIITVQGTDENIISLCYKLYGTTVNETLDFFINTNKLTGDEIINIPKGKKIKYYV